MANWEVRCAGSRWFPIGGDRNAETMASRRFCQSQSLNARSRIEHLYPRRVPRHPVSAQWWIPMRHSSPVTALDSCSLFGQSFASEVANFASLALFPSRWRVILNLTSKVVTCKTLVLCPQFPNYPPERCNAFRNRGPTSERQECCRCSHLGFSNSIRAS